MPKGLLAANPDAADAYLTLGAANYIIGGLPAFKRCFLHFKGISGDKRRGLDQLEIAALRGHYVRPFAKVLLALAALREKEYPVARISAYGARRRVSAEFTLCRGTGQTRWS